MHSIVISTGTVIIGDAVSTTVIICAAELWLPQSPVAIQVLVIIFVLPHASATASVSVIVTEPQVSVPVAIPVFAEDSSSVHSIVISAGI